MLDKSVDMSVAHGRTKMTLVMLILQRKITIFLGLSLTTYEAEIEREAVVAAGSGGTLTRGNTQPLCALAGRH